MGEDAVASLNLLLVAGGSGCSGNAWVTVCFGVSAGAATVGGRSECVLELDGASAGAETGVVAGAGPPCWVLNRVSVGVGVGAGVLRSGGW